MKLAILSDLHAVAGTLSQAMEAVRLEGFDELIILGDLLTYGVEPEKTIDIVTDAVVRDDAVLIRGNHDQLYIEMDEGECPYYERLNDWVRESVDWTRQQLPAGTMKNLPWRESWSSGEFFAAHANPYQYGDWTYLRTEQELRWACRTLAKRGYRWGVFGHTHRVVRYESESQAVFTVGSLGQPRDRGDRRLQWAVAEFNENSIVVQSRPVEFEVKSHLASIDATSMTAATKERLAMFFQ
jgi:predicted phosphodiesterase